MRALRAIVLALAAATLALAGCATPSAGERPSVTVAAAADLKFAFDEIVDLLATEHPDLDVTVTYGSSGQFVQQIRNGAPFDIYLSADRAYVQDLVDDGLADPGEVFDYAIGRLVAWYPGATDSSVTVDRLADPSVRSVAIANPEHAPYGRAAMAALDSLGLRADVEPKLVLGENVSQAAEFARTGNADAAIVALSLVLADPVRDVGAWVEVPLDAYPTLEQAGTVLAEAEHPDAARLVRDTMLGDAGRAILAEYGFSLPTDQS